MLVGRIHGAQDVELHLVAAQRFPAAHHLLEGAVAAAVDAVGVVDLLRPVHAQADQEAVRLEKPAPVIVQQHAVGLEGVLDFLVRPNVLLHELHGTFEEVQPHERGLAALPRHGDRGRRVRLQELANVVLQRPLRHAALGVGIERFLGQEETVRAVQVARTAAGLCQQMEARRSMLKRRDGG